MSQETGGPPGGVERPTPKRPLEPVPAGVSPSASNQESQDPNTFFAVRGGGRRAQPRGAVGIPGIPGVPLPERKKIGRRRFLQIAAGTAATAAVTLAGGAIASRLLGGKGAVEGGEPGGAPTANVNPTEAPTGTAAANPEPKQTATNTPEPKPTLIPEIPSSINLYPEKISSENMRTYGKVTIAQTDQSLIREKCYIYDCKPMGRVTLNTEDYDDAAQRLNDGVDYAFYEAYLTKHAISDIDFSFEAYKSMLYAGNEDLSINLIANIGSVTMKPDMIPDVSKISVDPRKPIVVVWTSEPYPYMKYVGLGSNTGVRLGYRVIGDQLFLEIFSGSGSNGTNILSSGAMPKDFEACSHFSALLAIMGKQTIQESAAKNFALTLGSVGLFKETKNKIDKFLIPEKKGESNMNSILVVN